MQSSRFIEIARNLKDDLRLDEIESIVGSLLVPGKGSIEQENTAAIGLILGAQNQLYFLTRSSPDFGDVASNLGIKSLFETEYVSKLVHILTTFNGSNQLLQNIPSVRTLSIFASRIAAFNRVLAGLIKQIDEPRKSGLLEEESLIEFDIWDFGRVGFSFQRVESILPEIEGLLVEVGKILGIENRNVKILYIDSGSNMLIGVKADGKLVNAVKSLFKTVWETIRYRKHADIKQNLSSITSSLEVMQIIDSNEQAGVIDHETALRMRHNVKANLFGLIEKGVSLHELQKVDIVDNRLIMRDHVESRYLEDRTTGEHPQISGESNESQS